MLVRTPNQRIRARVEQERPLSMGKQLVLSASAPVLSPEQAYSAANRSPPYQVCVNLPIADNK